MSPAEKRQTMSFWIPGKAAVTPVFQRTIFVPGVLPVEIFKLTWHSNIQSLHLYYTLREEAAEVGNLKIRIKGNTEDVFPAAWSPVGSALHSKLALGKWLGLFVKQNSSGFPLPKGSKPWETAFNSLEIYWLLLGKSQAGKPGWKPSVYSYSITDLLHRALPEREKTITQIFYFMETQVWRSPGPQLRHETAQNPPL